MRKWLAAVFITLASFGMVTSFVVGTPSQNLAGSNWQ